MGAIFAAPRAPAEAHYLWPCNVQAWALWQAAQTQWRSAGMGSPTGLDYAGVRALLDEESDLPPGSEERRHVFDCIRAAEHAVLEVLAEQHKSK